MLGELRKIESNHNNLRTKSMKGEFQYKPEVGKPFVIFGESICPVVKANGGERIIHTTPITKVEYNPDTKTYRFNTANSIYELALL